MPTSNLQPLDDQVPGSVILPAPRLWVVCGLFFIHVVGVIAARNLWSIFFRGKDPQIEMAYANFVGFGVLAMLCFVFKKRMTRVRIIDALCAVVLGGLSTFAGMGWGILNGYGR